jgi:hypothetical protein
MLGLHAPKLSELHPAMAVEARDLFRCQPCREFVRFFSLRSSRFTPRQTEAPLRHDGAAKPSHG